MLPKLPFRGCYPATHSIVIGLARVPDIGTVTRSRLTSVISGRQENQKKLLLRADKDDGVAV